MWKEYACEEFENYQHIKYLHHTSKQAGHFQTTAKTFLPCVRWSRSGSEGYIAGTLSWSATGCRTSCAEAACRCATPPGMKAVSFGGRGGFGYLVNFSFNNTVTLRAFSDLASVSFVISLVSFCLHISWTQDASLTRNRFSSKAICDQVRLRHRCGVLILICGMRKYDIAEVYLSAMHVQLLKTVLKLFPYPSRYGLKPAKFDINSDNSQQTKRFTFSIIFINFRGKNRVCCYENEQLLKNSTTTTWQSMTNQKSSHETYGLASEQLKRLRDNNRKKWLSERETWTWLSECEIWTSVQQQRPTRLLK